MASLATLSCDRCDFAAGGSDGELYVVCDDGSEVLCWHPGEWREAERETGHEYDYLKEKDRFRRRESYLCLHCGTNGFYGWHDKQVEGVIPPYERFAHAGGVHRSPTLQCASCGQQRLHRIAGFGTLILNFPGLRPLRPKCPRCKKGRLRCSWSAIS